MERFLSVPKKGGYLTMETLVDLLRQASEQFGSSTALIIKPSFRQQRWSYNRLWEASGNMAALLQGRGLAKGDRVIIWAPNRPEWVVAFFGCLRAGVVAVPLDVRSEPDFVDRIIQQTAPKLAFLSRYTPGGLPDPNLPVLLLEDLEELLEGVTPMDEPAVTREDIAEVMFTSGTTGDPKGVILTHGNIVANVQAAVTQVPVKRWYRSLSLLPLTHMFEQMGGLLAPLSGGATVIYPVSRQPSIIFKTMKENRATNMVLVPQALELFMNAIERQVRAQGKERQWRLLVRLASLLPKKARRWLFRPVHQQLGGRLTFITCGGAYLDPELAKKWEVLGIDVLQGYGTTEASPAITINTFGQKKLGSVGRLLPGQEIRIADDGEILVRGPNVTPGYWQNPEATAAAFEDGWYKTGDLGSLDDKGFLYLKGRKKDLIVLASGQNVYPEDIETILCRLPGVKDGVVLGLPKGGGSVEVHAALLLDDGSQAPELVRAANKVLAAHQQIQGFTVWPEEDFPRTHTLKVRKPIVLEYIQRQGTEPQGTPRTTPQAPAVAQSDLQRVVASVCSLPVEKLTPEKNLGFDLNLDSLGRVELLSAIEQELGVYIDESQVGSETTMAELQELVAKQAQGRGSGLSFYRWPLTAWCTVLRAGLHHAIIFPWLSALYRITVTGQDNLEGVKGPVLFAMNHNAALWDSLLLLKALPGR